MSKQITSEDTNNLPDNIRQYVMELETFADPAGIVRRNMELEDVNNCLQAKVAEMKLEIELLKRPHG
jgi:hypothetical protein